MFGDRFSAELSVSSERARRFVELVGPTSEPVYATVTTHLYPLDLNVSYQLLTNSRWRPYIGGGMRYVKDTFHAAARHISFVASQTIDPEVSGGIALQFNPAIGVRLDAKQVLGSYRSKVADPEFKASLGVSVRF